ncbi:expressed unknown protein [Seminavis robusta]|uniref:Uncharacterized protein n=1 Tax=Seminavis robusta TaxID=568900 RepID=A0A9N8D898_9STRA|nr:expressed unknown protein [Seminavis robusta]|eukprot:Sro1_g000130.1 n/a (136) ;mRNA; f:51391-51798
MILDSQQKPGTASTAMFDMLLDANNPTKYTETSFDEDILLNDEDEHDNVLMSSISLDDSASFLTIDDDDDVEEESEDTTEKSSSSTLPLLHQVFPDETLFDAKEQRFEWDDDFSILKKLRRTRLSTVVEDDNQER